MSRVQADHSDERVLMVRPSALGDVARTVPVLVSLKRANPGAVIDWLVQDSFAEVIAHHPDLHEVVAFARQRFRRFGRSWSVTREVIGYLRDLRRRGYDRVYDLQGLSRSGWLTWTTRAKHRVGASDAREGAWIGYTKRVRIEPPAVHTVDHMLGIIAGDGIEPVRDMRLYVGPADRQWAEQWCKQHGLTQERFAVVAPTARWLSKSWPAERFDAVVNRLGEYGFDAVVVIGADGEREQAAALLDGADDRRGGSGGVRRIDLMGQTSVGQMMAVIEAGGLVLANDSAALHIAVGLNRRAVSIFGPTDPREVGPYRYDTGVVYAEADRRIHYRSAGDDRTLISMVTVDRVWSAVERVMSSPPPLDPATGEPIGPDRTGSASGVDQPLSTP